MTNCHDIETYMQRCLDLAIQGRGNVAPNPMVGCVIVHQGHIIGEGYHVRYGEAHAEVNAIQSVKNKHLLKESTLYVNLEPCCHFGKTPPCSELIVKHNIPKIIIGTEDINPKVACKGIDMLKSNGCNIQIGILKNECYALNKRFFTFFQKERPYIILKWAQTLDGFMDISPSLKKDGKNYWITNEALKYKVHRWRAEESAIFVGADTIRNDNPKLNIRYGYGNNPIRITFLKKPFEKKDYHFFDNNQKTILFNTFHENKNGITQYINLSNTETYEEEMLQNLYTMKCQSIIIEGGKKTLERFIQKNLWDEARILIGNNCFCQGLSAPTLPILPFKIETIENNTVLYVQNPSIYSLISSH